MRHQQQQDRLTQRCTQCDGSHLIFSILGSTELRWIWKIFSHLPPLSHHILNAFSSPYLPHLPSTLHYVTIVKLSVSSSAFLRTIPLHPSLHSFLPLGWFPSGFKSLCTTLKPSESESKCLFNVNDSQLPGPPPFGMTVHLNDRRVLKTRKARLHRGHSNRCLIIASAGETQ